ncbi:aurora kinase A and ninein-interacting protein [Trichosurus vulpecula]|uniref:aurora kinase A and ninein-interacting protein n=1 Tax=Trichosurus vulpecula TaxID=9337 RepID=UPI00186B4985|nr:aurora kinase A and ninein-interacting protein [Trichosurus vulpecula]
MRRRGPAEAEAEACGVWLDAAALKKRKVQTRLSNPITRMLPPARGERETIVGFTQRRAQPVGTRQTLIASFFTSKSGKANDGGQGRPSPGTASQRKKEQKRDVMWLDPPPLVPGDECAQCPETAAASVTNEPEELICPPPSPKEVPDCCREARPAVLSSQGQKLPLPQLDTVGSTEVDFDFTQNSEGLGVLAHGREGGKIHYRQGQETKCLVDRADLERTVFSKENKQFFVLPQGHQEGKAGKGENREPWWGRDTELVEKRPCSSQAFSWDSERYDLDLRSQLFTKDSQGQRVIAHPPRAALQDIANLPRKPLCTSLSSQVQCQSKSVLSTSHLNSQPDMLFTQDSQGNRVIKHCF